ncbi:hypothetical protein, partial [Rhodovulum sulfidophilum]|uniref:hypothetical protein n=1 Tax=Rhodovulum sulfidophilum TaxID=35806 RepID=UPI001EE3F9D7
GPPVLDLVGRGGWSTHPLQLSRWIHEVNRPRALCNRVAVGSYASDLPEGYDTAKEDLENAGLLPVAEGNGLLFSVDEERHLHSAYALSVWPDPVILDVAEPLCIPAASAQIDLRKNTRSLIIKLERRE